MIECRHCRRFFREEPETVGARCPRCRQPLYERVEPPRPPASPPPGEGMQACAAHPTRPAVGTCRRCRSPICALCRPRWQEQALCPACVDQEVANPQGALRSAGVLRRLAVCSLLLGLAGWMLLLGAGLPLVFAQGLSKEASVLVGLGLLLSLAPALFAIGQGVAVV